MSDNLSETGICNMALGRIGEKRINDFTNSDEAGTPAIQCRLHYNQTRDALIRSHWWRFARSRATLSQNAEYTADTTTFEWDFAYDLPNDYLRMWLKPFEDNSIGFHNTRRTYSLEGKQLLSDEGTMEIRYIRKVTDVTEFDPLFVEVLVLQLALKMVIPLAGGGRVGMAMRETLVQELFSRGGLMSRVRAMDKSETRTLGRADASTWNDSLRISSGDPARNFS
jgi:hypothetical protein